MALSCPSPSKTPAPDTIDCMTKTDKTPDRVPVYLPENRHRWASNDEVDKPRVILRGPNRLIEDIGRYRKKLNKRYFPRIAAYALTGVTLATILVYIYLR